MAIRTIPVSPNELQARPIQHDAAITSEEISRPPNSVDAENILAPLPLLKLLSLGISSLVAGINDSSLGALLPYILSTYHISTSIISLIYFTTFFGWLVCALTNPHLTSLFPLGILLSIGALLQILPHALRA